jgi:hypothetical protein
MAQNYGHVPGKQCRLSGNLPLADCGPRILMKNRARCPRLFNELAQARIGDPGARPLSGPSLTLSNDWLGVRPVTPSADET